MNANDFLTQMYLSFFTFCLGIRRRYVSLSLRCILYLSFLYLHLASLYLVPWRWMTYFTTSNSLLFRSKLIPIYGWWVYFPRPLHRSIPLKSGWGLTQALDSTALTHCEVEARYVSLQVLIISFIFVHYHACIYYIHSYTSHILLLSWLIYSRMTMLEK